jgi:molybdate transport system substrate-binding protein
MDELIQKGKVVAGTKVDFARAGIGVVVKAGAPKPDISSPDAFKRTLLTAKSVAYSGTGASGVAMAQIVERLGLAAELKDKTQRINGRPIADAVAKGEVEIGMQQINTMLNVPGTDYIGPLPAELQEYIPFAMGLLVIAKEPEAARAMLNFVATKEAERLIRKSGMEPMGQR